MPSVLGRRRRLSVGLGCLQIFVGIGGIAGGVGLVTDPSGTNVGIHVSTLASSPFSDYLIPGIILLATHGIGSFSGGVLSLLAHRQAGKIGVLLGGFLLVWIVAQVGWIGLIHWLQPLFFGLGLLEIVLGLRLWGGMREPYSS